jgi:hypothetical protein
MQDAQKKKKIINRPTHNPNDNAPPKQGPRTVGESQKTIEQMKNEQCPET